MVLSESGAQPSGVRDRVQADGTMICRVGTCRARAACLLVALLALGGCSSQSWSSINPINWWHGLEGGAIAQQRPPPPGADQPDPSLASVPPKPEEPDRAALQNIADALIADRANAQRMAAAAPLGDPSSPSASPDLFGVGSTPPPGPAPPPGTAPAASATLPAANAPPAPPPAQANAPVTPPAKAPVGAVASNPLPEPSPPPAPLSVGSTLPPLPAAPPAPANVAGIPAAPTPAPAPAAPPVIPAPASVPSPAQSQAATAAPAPVPSSVPAPSASTAGAPARPAAPAPTTSAAPTPTTMASLTPSSEPVSAGNIVAVIFASGVASMPPSADALLRGLAGKRGNALIAVTGYGDAADANPDTQAAALKLGLARAQAIASALVADGVPATAVQIDAQAMGRGGTARLVK